MNAPLDAKSSSRASAAAELPSSSLNSQQQRPSFAQLMNAPLDAKSSSRASAAAELSSSSLNSRHQQPPQQAQQRPSFSQLMNAPLDAKSSSRGSAAAELSSSSLNSRHQQPPQQAQQRLTFAERMTVPIDAAKSSSRASASLFLPLPLEEDEEPTGMTRSLPVFFHKERASYGFLSNFYMPATFTDPISNIVFTSSEKYYMAAKAAVAQNAKSFHDIMKNNDPSIVKKHGSSFEVPTEWDWLKVGVMEVACYLKFSQNRDIGNALLDTGDAQLVEAAPNDSFWGIGINENEARHTERSMWPGKNFLGQVLMRVRQHLKDDTAPEASSQASQIISNFIKTSEELKRLINPQPSSQTSSLADVRLAGVPEVDDKEYASIVGLLREFANSKEHIYIWDPKNALVNASKIELQMYEKYLKSGGSSSSVSREARQHMRQKIAKYIPRFIEEQQHGIHSMGFDENLVRRALEIYHDNEQQAIEAILAGTVLVEEHREPESDSVLDRKLQSFDKKLVSRALIQANNNKAEAIEILVTNQILYLLKTTHGLDKINVGNGYEDIDRNMVVKVLRRYHNDTNSTVGYLLSRPRPEKIYTKEERYIMDMNIVDNGGGGNCLFTTLVGSLQNLFRHLRNEEDLNSVPHDDALMRQAIVKFERDNYNKEIFYPPVSPIDAELSGMDSLNTTILDERDRGVKIGSTTESFETVEGYFDLMQQDRAYGTHIELMAVAIMFNVDILVQIQTNSTFLRYASQVDRQLERIIYIFKNDDSGHYSWKNPYGQSAGKQKQQKQQQKSRKINCKKLSKRYSRYKKNLYKYSSPTQAQKMATKYLGKTAKLYPANNPVKKYRICDPVSKKWVNFGQLGYEDYTRHKNKTRRHNYLTRTANMRGNWKSNKYSANNLSRRVLW
jgi:hypothetical protein